jgi:hypothetical protein
LEFAGVLTWVNRIMRERVRERDLFGQWAYRWRVVRTSNAYLFRDPLPCAEGRPSLRWTAPDGAETRRVGRFASKSENPPRTLIPDLELKNSNERSTALAALVRIRDAWETSRRRNAAAKLA